LLVVLVLVLVLVLVWDATSTGLRRGSADQSINILIEIDGPL